MDGNEINIGDSVIAINPENCRDFIGTVRAIKTDTDGSVYAEVEDQDGDTFCVDDIVEIY